MKYLVVLLMGTAMSFAAQATIVGNQTFTSSLASAGVTQSGELARFDSSLGTLTGVTFTFIGRYETALQLTNTSNTTQFVSLATSTDISFSSSDLPLLSLFGTAAPVITLTDQTSTRGVHPGRSLDFGVLSGQDGMRISSTLPALLSSLSRAGGGGFDIGCNAATGYSIIGGANDLVTQQTMAGCAVSVTYQYQTLAGNDIPEPGSLALCTLALAGASLTAARRKVASPA